MIKKAQAPEKQLQYDLQWVIHDPTIPFENISEHIINTINGSPIDDEYKWPLTHKVNSFISKLPSCNLTMIQAYTENLWNEIVNKEWSINIRGFKQVSIGQDRWNKRQDKFFIEPILKSDNDKLARRWWVARELIRDLFQLPPWPDHEQTMLDLDTLITSNSLEQIKSEYPSISSDGIRIVDSIDTKNILQDLQKADLTSNQVIITYDTIYFSEQCLVSLESWITELVAPGKTFYWLKSYKKNGEIIISPDQLFNRGIRWLIKGKFKWLRIPQHNLQKKNLEALFFWSEPGTMLRRLYQKNDPNKRQIVYNLARIMVELGFIEQPKDIFDFIINDLKSKNRLEMFFSYQNEEGLTRWKIEKYMKLVLQEMLSIASSETMKERLAQYDTTDNEVITLEFKEKNMYNIQRQKFVSDEARLFSKAAGKFEDQYLQAYKIT